MSRAQRDRGARYEREVVAMFRDHGFPLAARTSDGRDQRTRGDIAGIEGVSVECKRTQRFALWPSWDQAVAQAGEAMPVVLTRRDGAPSLAVTLATDLLPLLKAREL